MTLAEAEAERAGLHCYFQSGVVRFYNFATSSYIVERQPCGYEQ